MSSRRSDTLWSIERGTSTSSEGREARTCERRSTALRTSGSMLRRSSVARDHPLTSMSGSQVEEAGQFITTEPNSPSPECPILTMIHARFQNGKPVNSGYSGRLRSDTLRRPRTLEKASSRLFNLLVTGWGADKNHFSHFLPPAPGLQEPSHVRFPTI